MMHKNSQLSLLGSPPKLPGKRIDPDDNSRESRPWRPLAALWLRWKELLGYRQRSAVEPTASERVEIEAQVSKALYPKRFTG
jgi:hypothetical protein